MLTGGTLAHISYLHLSDFGSTLPGSSGSGAGQVSPTIAMRKCVTALTGCPICRSYPNTFNVSRV